MPDLSTRQSILRAELAITQAHQGHRDSHPARREAAVLREQFPAFLGPIDGEDLIAGRVAHTLVGLTPDEWGQTTFGYYCEFDAIRGLLGREDLGPSERASVQEMLAYWEHEHTAAKVRAAYDEELSHWLPSDNWMGSSGVAFPLYRMTGGNIDFAKLLRRGVGGLQEELDVLIEDCDADALALYTGMREALDIFSSSAIHYRDEAMRRAREQADGRPENQQRRTELEAMGASLERIAQHPAASFHDAVQLFWLYSIHADVRNYGRTDTFLGPYLAADLDSGRITWDEALELTLSLWRLIEARGTRVHGRVIIGGRGRDDEDSADRFALLALEATARFPAIEPQLSLRVSDRMRDDLWDRALDALAEGRTFPILYNDNVNIDAVQRAFGCDVERALQYVPYGCGEYVFDHRSFNTPSGVINLLKALEVTLHGGRDPETGEVAGLELGEFASFPEFSDLLGAFERQVEHFVRLMARQEAIEYRVVGEQAPFLYQSLLYDDCLMRGRGMFSGGIDWIGGALETYGNTNAADSLLAIKRLVYDEQTVDANELLNALDADFVGYELLRKRLKSLPKYGNDNEEADEMLAHVHEHVCRTAREQASEVGLDSYLVVIINNSANTLMGRFTSASADGRLGRTSMNNGNAPSSGNDRDGLTAMLNSVRKPDPGIHAGAVQNLKLSRDLFSGDRSIVRRLLQVHFDQGGTQLMVTVLNRDDLESALKRPEEYRDLFVRVGGFTARFVELDPDVQREILERTLY